MHFRSKNVSQSNVIFVLGNEEIAYTKSYKYLGVLLNEHLDFSVTANAIAEQPSQQVGQCKQQMLSMTSMGFDNYQKMFITRIPPVMNYNAEVWGTKGYNTTQK